MKQKKTAAYKSPNSRTSSEKVRQRLRAEILAGTLPPGTIITSVGLAEKYELSRTPVREAIRILTEEGFLVRRQRQRAYVAEPSIEELETVFVARILFTVLCVRLSVPKLVDEDLLEMSKLISEMNRFNEIGDQAGWREADTLFHKVILKHAPIHLIADLDRLFDRSTLFRAIWHENPNKSILYPNNDHELILEACKARDSDEVARVSAQHLMRVTLALVGIIDPSKDLEALRETFSLLPMTE